jgi:hypothetical protein
VAVVEKQLSTKRKPWEGEEANLLAAEQNKRIQLMETIIRAH